MRLRSLLAGAALVTAAATPAMAADWQTNGTASMSPEVREMHRDMGVDLSGGTARQTPRSPDLLVGTQRPSDDTVIITQRQAYPELFAAEIDGVATIDNQTPPSRTMVEPAE